MSSDFPTQSPRLDSPRWSRRKRKLGVKILDRDNAELLDDHHLLCCWDTCEKHGLSLFWARENGGTPGYPLVRTYHFCSEKHKQYWVNSTRDLYNLPKGMRLSVQ